MTVERYIRMIAGTFVLVSLALGYWVDPRWFLFTAFVGLNLFQSSLTRWCLMENILKKFGVGTPATSACCGGLGKHDRAAAAPSNRL